MEIVDDLEAEPRGVYGGGVGYYSWTGDADFAIVIRTATVEHGVARSATESASGEHREPRAGVESPDGGVTDPDGCTPSGTTDRTTVQAGAGLVADSVPEREYEETEQKMAGVLDAVDVIERAGRDATTEEVSR
jgi:anthranilate synthase component 1